jgi:hypothetical protein
MTGADGEFWVSAADKNGRHYVYNTTPDGEDHKIGFADGVESVLNTMTPRNEMTGAWQNVPKDFALSLTRQEVGIQDHVFKMYDSAKAGTANGMIWWQSMSGQISDTDALDKTEPELLKMQVESPLKPWSDGPVAAMASAAPWALGKAAQVLPSMIAGIARGTELLPATALAATTAASIAGGPAGLAALATPAGVAGVLGASATAGMFDFTFKVTAGSIYGDLRRSNIDPKVAKSIAPVAGIMAGMLEVVGFKFFTASMKRTFAAKVLGNEAVKKQMAKWYMNYLKETGAEAGVESAQQVVEEYSKNFAAMVEDRPELMKSQADIAKSALQAGVDAFVGMGIIKAPMAMVEGAASRPDAAKKTPAPKAAETPAAPAKALSIVEKAMVDAEAKAPTAPAMEQELVAAEPEVAAALSQLNAELDPLAPEAGAVYEEMGTELAGDENAAAAVTAKVEALRSEMMDILAEQDNTPLEQRRVAEIQREIGLLDGMRRRMETEAPVAEEMGAAFEEGGLADGAEIAVTPQREGKAPAPAKTPKRPITGARARIQKKVVAARDAKLVSELNNTLTMVKELEASRSRLDKAGRATKFIDNKIAELTNEVYRIDAERETLAETGEVAEGAALEMKPATLESIEKAAFTEGRKEVTKRRVELMKEVADQYGLSDRDVKSLIKSRNLGVMSDFDFKKYIDVIRGEAAELNRKKQAASELAAARDAKQLKNEQSLRRINNLPPVSKMTVEQMRTYAELVEGYETGDTFWTPKRIDALKSTMFTGAETIQGVLRIAADLFNVPLEDLGKITLSEFDRFRYDTALARRHPLFDFMVDTVKTSVLKSEAAYFAFREEHNRLAKDALKSRNALDAAKGEKGFMSRVSDWLVPQQAAVMAYLEAQTPEAKAAAAAALTPEELKLAEFQEKFYADAYKYLLAGNDLKSSRFADGGYVFHARRPLSEILRDIKETGVKDAVSDIVSMWKQDETRFSATDQKTGAPLGLRKFFRQTLFRSGELTPSKNILRSTDIYARQFFKKQALDEAVPAVETLTMAVASLNKTEEGKQMGAALEGFVRDYLNAKKGKAAMLGVVQGGKLDALIRFATGAMSFMTMGANTVVQAAAPVGEAAAKTVALGYRAYSKALYRRATKQGRAIVSKYKYFTGEGVIEGFMEPGQTLENRVMMLAYGVFKWSRVNTMKDLLLGSMTDAEFAAGEISDKRLAQIKKEAGRWIDVGDAKSIYGTTSVWKSETQFKSWAIPIMSSSLDILNGIIKSAAKGKNVLTPQQQSEILRIVMTTSLVTLASAMVGGADKDDDSYLGRLKFTVMREMSTLVQAMNPLMFLMGPASFAWVMRFAQNLALMVQLEKIEKTGELRGWKNMKRQLTPAIAKQMGVGAKKEPKKNRYAPAKFKREKE